MPPVGKEFEPPKNIDQIATREVQGYIEMVEKQSEIKVDDKPVVTTTPTPDPQTLQDMGVLVAAQFAQQTKGKIVLPLQKEEIEQGLHQKIGEGIRWLSEWCLMMIKKYPGRVFYMTPKV